MLYFIGGISRSGKTTLARQLLEQRNIPYFSLDYLMMGVAKGIPELDVDSEDNDFAVGSKLWHIIDPMVTAMVENHIDYIIEGSQLIPKNVIQLHERYQESVRSCFLGYSKISIKEKINDLKKYSHLSENDWLRDYDESLLEAVIERFVISSIELERECKKYNLKYIDVSNCFMYQLEKAYELLIRE